MGNSYRISKMNQLISRDSKGKIRVVEMFYEWNEEQHGYVIHRSTGLLNGKMVEQPDIVILKGKASRTLKEQVELEYNSNKKKYLDKGYRELENPLEDYSEEELNNILGDVRTGQNGVPKPQLAKQADKVTNLKTFDKKYWGSRKIDGLRCLIYLGEDGKLHTASRGATNYDAAMIEILEHPDLIQLFKDNPTLIMDGECYKHGYSLQQLNSVARTQVKAVDYEILQFYWYDIVDLNSPVTERINKIKELAEPLSLTFEPEREFQYGELRIQLVPHVEVSGWDNIMALHNEYVSEGWEGLVIRLESSLYGPNKRTNDWLKVKCYKQDTYKVIGIEQGLRKYDDMVFVLETEEGKQFKAKPFGDKNQKIEYTDNFEEKYQNHLGDVKYFYYSDEGTPLQPSFIAFRPDLE
jgi:ATP-dependent DNA ligase